MLLLDKLFQYTGFYGPQILFIFSIFFLRKKINFMIIYIIGFVINILLNYFLKGLFQQPRPTDEIHLFKMEELYRKKLGFEKYGMPSGHAQMVFYSTIFNYYLLGDVKIAFLYLIISLITCYQRIENKNHTLFQVIIGSFVGMFVGFIFFNIGEKQTKKVLKNKIDDNHFILLTIKH